MRQLSDRDPQRQHQQKSGRPKRAFTSREEAQAYADYLSRKGVRPMEAYLCGICSQYHNGHARQPAGSHRSIWNQEPELGYRVVNATIVENRGTSKSRRRHLRRRFPPTERASA